MSNFTKMQDRSDTEINQNIQDAVAECKSKDLDFYKILTGIDAYFEKRFRKNTTATGWSNPA